MSKQSQMRFLGTDRWYRESECGNWRIPKVITNGVARYEVWEKHSVRWQQVRVNIPTYEEAIKAAGFHDRPGAFLDARQHENGDGV